MHKPLNLYAVPFRATCVGTMYLMAESEEQADELAGKIDADTIDYYPEHNDGNAAGPAYLLSTRAEITALFGPGLPTVIEEMEAQRRTCHNASAFAGQSARRQTNLTEKLLDYEMVRAWDARARALLKKQRAIEANNPS